MFATKPEKVQRLGMLLQVAVVSRDFLASQHQPESVCGRGHGQHLVRKVSRGLHVGACLFLCVSNQIRSTDQLSPPFFRCETILRSTLTKHRVYQCGCLCLGGYLFINVGFGTPESRCILGVKLTRLLHCTFCRFISCRDPGDCNVCCQSSSSFSLSTPYRCFSIGLLCSLSGSLVYMCVCVCIVVAGSRQP